jgi:hypothetical protein
LIDTFQLLPITAGMANEEVLRRMRLNSLGELYFFIKVTLKRNKLTDHFHRPICNSLQRDSIKDVYEIPRDHYKSTIASEGLPMWWALPFEQSDVDEFLKLGYSDEFIRWMARIHRPEIRNLLASENITNAAKLGNRIRYHFESNDRYRAIFPETLPDESCQWSNFSLRVKIPANRAKGHGEGTFDFLGVGGALQSRHYDNAIEDDLVGRKAIESQSVMDKAIEYHQLLVGAFEAPDDLSLNNNELVIGNRWSYHDLNSYIREHEDGWNFQTHSAFGGCCPAHPADTILVPEIFTYDKLMAKKQRLGSYHFSCQFLNNPAAPENAEFKPAWLRYFTLEQDANGRYCRYESFTHPDGTDCEVKRDLRTRNLRIAMLVDPATSESAAIGRCRHAIMVVGLDSEGFWHLLEAWAETSSYEKFISQIYTFATKWNLSKFGLETIAAQKFLAYHINFLNHLEGRNLKIVQLKGEVEGPDGTITRKKEWRIRNVLLPIFESCRFCVQRKHVDFYGEYSTFPKGRFVDQLDALAYAPQLITLPQKQEFYMAARQQNQSYLRNVNASYNGPIH